MTRGSDEFILNSNLDRSEDILQMLEDTFGESNPKLVKHAEARYAEITMDGRPQSARMAATYLEWCIAHPKRIGNFQAVKHCTCDNGMVLVDESTQTFRPCERCLPSTFDKWSGVTLENDDEEDLGF